MRPFTYQQIFVNYKNYGGSPLAAAYGRLFYRSGEIRYERYYSGILLHRLDGPAYIDYYKSGQIRNKIYYVNHDRHRLAGPAYIEYDESGVILREEYWIYGLHLYRLEECYKQKEKLFEYIKTYPYYIEEVLFLACHNNWLTEDQLDLLTCIDMFT